MKPWQTLLLGVLFGLLAGAFILIIISRPTGEAVRLIPPSTPSPILVHITGAVAEPGVYTLPPGSRVQDAVQAAGGLSPTADETLVNLAARLKDGDKIRIPLTGEDAPALTEQKNQSGIIGATTLVDLNTALAVELETLPGIGPGRAEDIIAYREAHGPFKAITEIMNVPGIGQATFDLFKELITVSN